VVLGVSATADTQGSTPSAPAGDRWWPSAFGAEDQIGMLNHIDDAKRLAAMALVQEGRLI
jgi:hypothetical protein